MSLDGGDAMKVLYRYFTGKKELKIISLTSKE